MIEYERFYIYIRGTYNMLIHLEVQANKYVYIEVEVNIKHT